jgi:Zn-dependent protease
VFTSALILIAVLVPSVILHEVAHGWVALAFGDDTAKRAGRLTLNPVRHIDVFGTLILPAMLAFSGLGIFGYAKPVPVSPSRMRRPRDHGLLTSLAGPAVNIVLAVGAAYALRSYASDPTLGLRVDDPFAQVLVAFGVVNVILAAFNLLPIPPLDGSALIERFLPQPALRRWYRLRQYSMALLLLVVLLLPGVLGGIFDHAIRAWSVLL